MGSRLPHRRRPRTRSSRRHRAGFTVPMSRVVRASLRRQPGPWVPQPVPVRLRRRMPATEEVTIAGRTARGPWQERIGTAGTRPWWLVRRSTPCDCGVVRYNARAAAGTRGLGHPSLSTGLRSPASASSRKAASTITSRRRSPRPDATETGWNQPPGWRDLRLCRRHRAVANLKGEIGAFRPGGPGSGAKRREPGSHASTLRLT